MSIETQQAPQTRDELVGQAWERILAMLNNDERRREVSAALGMSFIKIKALRRLLSKPMPMGDLAARLAMDKPYLTQIVAALEERGLVVRTIDARDRRCRIVSLTDEGRATARRAEEILKRPPVLLTVLPEQDLAELTRILTSLPATGDGEPS